MIQRQSPVSLQTPAGLSAMPHIANSDHNEHQLYRSKLANLDRMVDMTLEKRSAMEQRARATQRLAAIGEMTGGIAHDFRNLLAVIKSGLRLAERSCEEPEKVRTYIAAARDGIDRGVKLTSQLLAFAKLQELEARAGDVNELLDSLRLLLKYSAGPGVRIKFGLGSTIPKCLVDPSQFGAAVLNLVVNARDAMPNGGVVEISTDRWQARAATSPSPTPGTYVRVRTQGQRARHARKSGTEGVRSVLHDQGCQGHRFGVAAGPCIHAADRRPCRRFE